MASISLRRIHREVEIQEIGVGTFQVVDKGWQGNLGAVCFLEANEIGYRQEGVAIHVGVTAYFFNRFISKS